METVPTRDPVDVQDRHDQRPATHQQPRGGRQIARPVTVGNRVLLIYSMAFVVYHAALPLVFVPWLFSWSGLLLVPVLHFVFDWVGVGLCYHLFRLRIAALPQGVDERLSRLGKRHR